MPANGQLRFYGKKSQLGNFGSIYTIRVSTASQTNPADFTTIQTWTETDFDYQNCQQKFVDLAAYVGQNVYVAFVMENDAGDRWLIDQVKIDEKCLAPTGLNVTPFATSADLSWTSPNPAGPWEIEYGPQGFVQGTGTIVNSATNTLTITGLSPLTSYSYYVRTICEPDNVSPWSAVRNFTTTVAPPVCGGNFVDNGGVSANYTNNADDTITICPTNPGDLVTVTFTSFNTEANWDALYVYDGNSIAAPQIASANGAGNVPGGVPGGFWGTTIPGPFTASSTNGCLTFRFRSDSSGTRAGWTANITCAPAPTCPRPTNITLLSATINTLEVSWTNNAPAATAYEVIWLPAGSPPPTAGSTGQITSTIPYTITGLNSQTTYDVYVRALCQPGGTDVGDWSVKGTFRTLPNYCGGDHFYDLGGPTGNYPDNITAAAGTTTICPANPGEVVTVYFNSFNLISSINDSLTIYDGDSATGTPVGTYFGTNIIPSYTATSPTGCLTFVFVSNGSQNAAGWDATILCGPPCPSITAVLDSTLPVAGSENVIRICQGQSVDFNGSAVFAADGTGATYQWNFGDGNTANGQSVSHVFANEGIYLVNLFVTDANGCRNSNRLNQLVYVSTTPNFSGITISDDEICLGQSSVITGAVTPVTFVRDCAPPVSGTTFLPDGSGVSYQTTIPVDCFPFGSTLTSASQITSVCLNMEHSYLGDLEIRLVSPTGQSIILKAYPGGAGTYLGCPLDDPAVGPGTGRDYCFTPTATTLLVNGATSNCGTPNGASINAGNYMPVNPFSNLIGSALNGNWSLIVTDNLGIDNGYIFNWSINFDSSLLPSDYQFTPVITSTSWDPDPTIVSVSGEQITVTPTATGTKCYTYNATDNFGCSYSRQVCIDVTPGVVFNPITVTPTICEGQDGVFTFSGTPNSTVTYNINGGADQTIVLDGSGNAVLTLTGLTASATLTATYSTAPPIPTSGNAISAVGGLNANNAVGAILAAGTTATTANSMTINAANPTTTLTLGHVIPAGTPVTVSIAKNTSAASVTIVDGPSSLVFNTGTLNILQHITFIKGTTSNTITINRTNGNTYLDGVAYTYNEPGCDRPLNMSATQIVNAVPTVAVASPVCTSDGVATITNYDPSFTYAFNPAGPTVGAGGVVSGMVIGTTYTVSTSNASCPLGDSAPFSIAAMLPSPVVPTITSTAPTCSADGSSLVSNYDGTLTYTFNPAGPTVGAGGVISGMVTGVTYTVVSNNGNCDSSVSLSFANSAQLPTPNVPTISVVAPTCSSNGTATVTNYDGAVTYIFTPVGPTVGAGGVISGISYGVSYVVSATDGVCTSADSLPFSVDAMFVTPVVPTIVTTAATCTSDGISSITNYDATLTYVFTPSGPSVTASGVISGMTVGTGYTVIATNGNCSSAASASFVNSQQLPSPVIPTVTVLDSEICAGETGAFQIVGTPNDIVSYSINGGALQNVTLNAQGEALIENANSTVTISIELLEVNNGLCTSPTSVSATIDVRNCAIPKGISPNNDGLNDSLDLSFYNIDKLEIFNRYGTKVYSKSNYENEWYGQSDGGDELPDGTYYFVIDFTDLETKTGWIYINRER